MACILYCCYYITMHYTFIEDNLLLQRGGRLDGPLLVSFQTNQIGGQFGGFIAQRPQLTVHLCELSGHLNRFVSAIGGEVRLLEN